jgi:hypothetical protein
MERHGSQDECEKKLDRERIRAAAKRHLNHDGRVRINPQGLDSWDVREGFLYDILETKKMDINLHDTDGKAHAIQIEGDRSITDLQEFVRRRYKIPARHRIIIMRQEIKPFWIEQDAHYTLAIQYDPNADARLRVRVRVDATDRSF